MGLNEWTAEQAARKDLTMSKRNGRLKKNGRVAYWSEGATALQKEGEKRTAVVQSGMHCRY